MQQQQQQILTVQELKRFYIDLEKKCQMIQDLQDAGEKIEVIIEKFTVAQKFITNNQLFSENEKIKEIASQNLRYLTLPYFMGFLYGRINNPRKEALEQQKNYLEAFLGLIQMFNSEDEIIFPQNILKTWRTIRQDKNFNYPRQQVITNHKEKRIIEERYKNSQKMRDEQDQRQSIKDFITLKVYDSITQLKNINEEFQMLQYKASIEKDPQQKRIHEEEQEKPIPKMKVWEVKKSPEQIHSCMCPPKQLGEQKKELVAQVWQENANQPTMSLSQVADLEMENMHQRTEREKKQREANQVDSDSDKQENDDRKKKEARSWDDWKDAHEKGAGNKGR